MKSEIQKKRDNIIKKILSDEKFLPNLSIEQQLKFIDKVQKAGSENQLYELVKKYEKMKRK